MTGGPVAGAGGGQQAAQPSQPSPQAKQAAAQPARKAMDAQLRTLMNPSEGEGIDKPAPQKADKKVVKRLMTPLHEAAIAEPEPERVHVARMALRRAVKQAEQTLGKTGSALKLSGGAGSLQEQALEQTGNHLKLFEDISSLKEHAPERSGLQLTLLLGITSFAAMGTCAALSILRTTRLERKVTANLLDADLDSTPSSAHTVVE